MPACRRATATTSATPAERQQACQTLLDTLRRALAIKVSYLDADGLDRIKQASYQFLKEPWALEEEGLRTASVAWVGPKERGAGRDDLSLSATSGVGHYLRRSSNL